MHPLYNLSKTFTENWESYSCEPEKPSRARTSLNRSFFDYTINSPIGVAACPIMHSKGIAHLASLGYDVFTYKTIRAQAHPAHALPNILFVESNMLQQQDIGTNIITKEAPSSDALFGIINSFGNACFDQQTTAAEIAAARAAIGRGQVLQVSVYGEGHDLPSLIDSFLQAAHLAHDAGAQVIELNLSCPNILAQKGLLYKDSTLSIAIGKAVAQALPNVPVSVKVGIFDNAYQLQRFMTQLARSGVRGICGINTIPMKALNDTGVPAFGDTRPVAGISGDPIRPLAQAFVRDAARINQTEQLGLTIIGVGGVTAAHHFKELLACGATVALSATGVMWRPQLGQEYHLENNHARSIIPARLCT